MLPEDFTKTIHATEPTPGITESNPSEPPINQPQATQSVLDKQLIISGIVFIATLVLSIILIASSSGSEGVGTGLLVVWLIVVVGVPAFANSVWLLIRNILRSLRSPKF